jgi:hypothetical protein
LKESRWSFITLAVLLIFAATRDVSYLFSYPVAVGADGYYYVLQINELLKSHHLFYPSNTPIVFWILAALTLVTKNVVVAIKLGSIAFNLCLCAAFFVLVSRITRSRWLGVLGVGIVALSGMHLYMIAEFIKNLAGITFFFWGTWCVIYAVESNRVWWIAAVSVLLITCAALSHASIWIIAPVMLVVALIIRRLKGDERWNWVMLFTALVVCLGLTCAALLAYQEVFSLPAWLAIEVTHLRFPITLRNPVGKAEAFMLLCTVPLALFLILRNWNKVPNQSFRVVVLTVSVWTLLITLNPFLNHDITQLGIVGRLDHLMYLQVAMLVPAVIYLALGTNKKVAIIYSVLTIFFVIASMAAPLPRGLRSSYLEERQQIIEALPLQRQQLGPDAFVIAQHGDEFLVTWLLGTPAQQTFPVSSGGKSIFWMVHQVKPNTVTTEMVVVMDEENGSALVLMKHGDMVQWINMLNARDRNQLWEVNPHLKKYIDDQSKSHTTTLSPSHRWSVSHRVQHLPADG